MINTMQTLTLLSFSLLLFLSALPAQTRAQSFLDEFPGAAELLEQYSTFGSSNIPSQSAIEEMVSNVNKPTLTYSPTNSKPGDRVTLRIQDYGNPTDSSLITWFVDGALFSSGIGAKSISFNVGAIGTTSTVYAEITRRSGSVEQTAPVVVGASHVDILWEAVDAQVPPFYKGKALPSWDTIIKTYALPEVYGTEGQQIPRSEFVYTWKKNQSAIDLNPQSGYGKDNVYVLADFARKQHVVGVDISHASSGTSSFDSISVKLHDPETVLYEKHPLQGIIFERAIPATVNQPISSGSLRIVAYPFGIDKRSRGDISYTWKLNGRTLNNTGVMSAGEIPLVASDSPGISTVSVETRNKTKPLQTTSGLLRINVE